jgi:hypothetical protein
MILRVPAAYRDPLASGRGDRSYYGANQILAFGIACSLEPVIDIFC